MSADMTIVGAAPAAEDQEKALPLPGWLKRVYFIFPVILYLPDAIFNFWVYSDGVKQTGNTLLDASQMVLWACVSLGVVGMAYLLSVIAPWHWRNSHRLQAFFCGLGVLIATAITTWNSLSYRSDGFTAFKTDAWASQLWPQLQQLSGVSVTMILVSLAPPFWGLFWAIVQPIDTHKGLDHLRLNHEEKLLRTQQEAELKAIRAEANARVRAAQLKGMAATAATAREQAKGLFKKDGGADDGTGSAPAAPVAAGAPAAVTLHALPEPDREPEPAPQPPAPLPPAASVAQPASRGGRTSRSSSSSTGAARRSIPAAAAAAAPAMSARTVAAGDQPTYAEPRVASPLASAQPSHLTDPAQATFQRLSF